MTSETGQMIAGVLGPLLAEHCTPENLRLFERGELLTPLWTRIDDLGFADVLLPEAAGGAGLGLSDLGELSFMFGRHLLPVPLADSMVARAILAAAGHEMTGGPIVLATSEDGARLTTAAVPLARAASQALIECGDRLHLVDLTAGTLVAAGGDRSLSAGIRIARLEGPSFGRAPVPLRVIAAALRASEMAGMISRLLDLSLDYANNRQQFGKTIGSFQAVQQQLAVLAEETAAARMAARLAFAGAGHLDALRVGIAKMRVGAAAAKAAGIAHAVHGAIGMSEEYDLQLYSRRLIEYRLAEGSETYWAADVGRRRLADPAPGNLDFVRGCFVMA